MQVAMRSVCMFRGYCKRNLHRKLEPLFYSVQGKYIRENSDIFYTKSPILVLQQCQMHMERQPLHPEGNVYIGNLPCRDKSSNELYCLQFDLTDVNISDTKISRRDEDTFLSRMIQEIQSMKPEIVFLQYTDEKLYKMELLSDLKKLGYDSYYQKITDGRGHATFFRSKLSNSRGTD